MMKKREIVLMLACSLFIFAGCTKDSSDDQNGSVKFRCINPMASGLKSAPEMKSSESVWANPSLIGETTETLMVSLKLCIGDVWVSMDEVKAGKPDNLQWHKLTTVTNTQHKLFEDYEFPAVDIPAGTYKSIKITFKNVFYRVAQLATDPNVRYELLETMGGSGDPCNENDDSWAKTNYFSTDGNHYLDGGVFKLASAGEKVSGFTIEPGKKAILSWRLGAGATETCTNYLIDVNGNREWDCGIDEVEIVCPPSIQYMWDFVVDYE